MRLKLNRELAGSTSAKKYISQTTGNMESSSRRDLEPVRSHQRNQVCTTFAQLATRMSNSHFIGCSTHDTCEFKIYKPEGSQKLQRKYMLSRRCAAIHPLQE